jgi:hypothetical protein
MTTPTIQVQRYNTKEFRRQNINTPTIGLTYNKKWYIESGQIRNIDSDELDDDEYITEEIDTARFTGLNKLYQKHVEMLKKCSKEYFHLTLWITSVTYYSFTITHKDIGERTESFVRVFSHGAIAAGNGSTYTVKPFYDRLLEDY